MTDKTFKTAAFAIALMGAMATGLTAQTAAAASAEEVKICKETISEMTGGKPPAEAVKLCDQGKPNEAIEKAMAGGCRAQRSRRHRFEWCRRLPARRRVITNRPPVYRRRRLEEANGWT